jgi:hypothetical protein
MSDLNTLASATFIILSLVLLQSCSLGAPIAQVDELAAPQHDSNPVSYPTRHPISDDGITQASKELLWESELIHAGKESTLPGQARLLP